MNNPTSLPLQIPPLSEEDKAQLHLWAQATPSQRLAWLEEALALSANSKPSSIVDRKT